MPRKRNPLSSLSDQELLDLLFTSGDGLSREAIDECLSRGRRLLPNLWSIVADKSSWTQPLPEWWAVVHATYLIGAMEAPETLVCLLTALRWADAFDCDWVTEDLPSMFSRLGAIGYQSLHEVAADPSAGPGARSVALNSLAAIALRETDLLPAVLGQTAAVVEDDGEHLFLRQTAANILMDLRRPEHRDVLLAFGKEEAARHRENPEYEGCFYDWEVEEAYREGPGSAALEYYHRDWLVFYDPEEITRRRERWTREEEQRAAQGDGDMPASSPRDLDAPCSCGSGRPFSLCCYLRVH